MCEKTPSILPGDRICDSCRKELTTVSLPHPSDSFVSDSESDGTISPPDEDVHVDTGESLMIVNQCLDTIGETPLTKRKLQYKKKSKQKIEKIATMMQKAVIGDVHSDQMNDEGEIIKQLKEKFSTVGRSEKIQILTVLPKSWSIRRVQEEFGVSDFMARKAKLLVREKGVLSTTNPIPGHSLPQKTVQRNVRVPWRRLQVSTVVGPGVRTNEISRALICISLPGGHFVLVSTLHRECVSTL